MIVKLTLSADSFARLAQFLAGQRNSVDLIQELHPGERVCFLGKHSHVAFAKIIRSSPNKLSEGEQDVTLDIAENYTIGDSMSNIKPIPLTYIAKLFSEVWMYPKPVQVESEPFPIGSTLDTTEEDPSFSKTFRTEATLKARKWGMYGTIRGFKYDYGKCYIVEHRDGSMGLYFVTEMRLIPGKT
ncbi:MAG: hypothetical protein KA066_01560 [Candidatus Pacebacteria bacterium]|nr:hypothetical protein [Candidatus Paceibacterota bacterium]